MTALRSALLALVLIPLAGPAAPASEAKGEFAAVVRAHFAGWVKGSPKHALTPERVNALVNDRSVTGDEAAAAAAIHAYHRSLKSPAPLGERALLQAASGAVGPEERRDQVTRPIQLEGTFAQFRAHLRGVPREPFAMRFPRQAGLSQGRLGDCYVVSAVGAMAALHPGRLKGLFHPQPDGSCRVTFPGRAPILVPPLTDAQIALGSTAGKQGTWLNLMEEAVALASRPGGDPAVALDAIAEGGDAAQTIELLTGHRARKLRFRPTAAATEAPAGDAAAALAGRARDVLKAVRERRIEACVSTPASGHVPPGMATHHAYGIVGYDPAADAVTVWNPWGNSFAPKGPAGPKNGYPTRDGKFVVPLAEFVSVFATVSYETATPLRAK